MHKVRHFQHSIKICLYLCLTILLLSTSVFAAQKCDTCLRDKHGKIARSQNTKTEFKKLHPCPVTGKSTGKCPGYVIDHVKPLKRGGKDRPDNMQWQTKEEAKEKDKWE